MSRPPNDFDPLGILPSPLVREKGLPAPALPAHKSKPVHAAPPPRELTEHEQLLKKHDLDNDGRLSRTEMDAYREASMIEVDNMPCSRVAEKMRGLDQAIPGAWKALHLPEGDTRTPVRLTQDETRVSVEMARVINHSIGAVLHANPNLLPGGFAPITPEQARPLMESLRDAVNECSLAPGSDGKTTRRQSKDSPSRY